MKIALIGLMGSGKTEIGRCLAETLSLPFHDLDRLIETSSGLSIADLFRTRGEKAFRMLEHEMLASLSFSTEPMVLSCGGGSVLDTENRTLLHRHFVVVWLDVPLDELTRRLSLTDRSLRPLLAVPDWKEALASKYCERTPLYCEIAHVRYRWAGDAVPAQSAREIQKMVEEFISARNASLP